MKDYKQMRDGLMSGAFIASATDKEKEKDEVRDYIERLELKGEFI